jgi:hypothetical protein
MGEEQAGDYFPFNQPGQCDGRHLLPTRSRTFKGYHPSIVGGTDAGAL